jgi:hypothetical protein
MGITWQDPPPPNNKKPPAFTELRARPGAWALIETKSGPGYANQRAGWLRRRLPDFEFTVRGCDIYARYVGEVS